LEWKAAQAIIMNEARKDARLADKLQSAGETRWQELYNETKGSPLALMHVLGLMRTRTVLTFDGALEMLRGNRDADLQRFIFEEARKELGASDITALRALSFFLPSASFEALLAVADLSRNALEMSLDRLDALSLLDKTEGEERYALHPLTRAFVRDELLADATASHETGMRFARYWVDYAKRYGDENYKTYDRLEAEWTNLDAAANWLWETANVQDDKVGDKDAARMFNDLAGALNQFLWFGGRWDESVKLSTRAYEAMRALNDWSNAGWRAQEVAWIQWSHGHTDDASFWVDRCKEMWTRGGSKYEQLVASGMRGLVAWQSKDYAKAERLLQEAVATSRDLRQDASVAIALNDLGELACEREDYDAAEQYCREALELARKIDSKEFQSDVAGNLGELALDRQQWTEAHKWFEQELALAKDIGRVELIAQAQYGLARVWEAEGRADLALPLAQEALKIYERLQHKDLAAARGLVERLRGKTPPP
jgi:tetratricopeptide (TPR) repeat protein